MKKLKWIFGILLVLVLAVGGVLVYFTQIKEYDVADEKVDEVLEEGFELELPDGSVVVVDKDGNVLDEVSPTTQATTTFPEGTTVNEDGTTVTLPDGTVTDNVTTLPAGAVVQANGEAVLSTGETTAITYTSPTNTTTNNGVANGSTTTDATNTETNTDEQTTANAGSSNTGTTNNTTTDGNTSSNGGAVNSGGTGSTNDTTAPNTGGETSTGGKPTVSDIKNKYAGSFASLEGQAAAKLSGLIGTAKSEYATAKANGESVSYAYFYQKYYGAAQSLESNTDNAFNALLSVVKNELQANGYDASYADSFVTQYESAKKAREASLLDQVKSQF